MVPEVLAIVFGLVGIKDKKHKTGMAIAGTILGVVSIVAFIALIMYSIFEDPGFTPFGAAVHFPGSHCNWRNCFSYH